MVTVSYGCSTFRPFCKGWLFSLCWCFLKGLKPLIPERIHSETRKALLDVLLNKAEMSFSNERPESIPVSFGAMKIWNWTWEDSFGWSLISSQTSEWFVELKGGDTIGEYLSAHVVRKRSRRIGMVTYYIYAHLWSGAAIMWWRSHSISILFIGFIWKDKPLHMVNFEITTYIW